MKCRLLKNLCCILFEKNVRNAVGFEKIESFTEEGNEQKPKAWLGKVRIGVVPEACFSAPRQKLRATWAM